VPAPGDYDDEEIGGMMTGRGNRSTWRKPAHVLSTTNPKCSAPDGNLGRRSGKPMINRFSYGTALQSFPSKHIINMVILYNNYYI
jgi:hypothetical protein